jgi:hypothetical protein
MQRSIAIVLALLFGWSLVLPAFASSDVSMVAPCCRKAGKHHCTMHLQTRTSSPAVNTIAEKCPYCVYTAISPQAKLCTPTASQAIFAGLLQHPAVSPQTEVNYRISYDRSRQKRGPPTSIVS